MTDVAALLARLAARGETVAVAESLTGGLVCASLTEVPGASAVVRGGVVAYAVDVKTSLLDVPADLLDRYGPVHSSTALAMARGVRSRLTATWGVATTGVAGPESHGGRPVGQVHVAVVGPGQWATQRSLVIEGPRERVRGAAVAAALALLADGVRESGAAADR